MLVFRDTSEPPETSVCVKTTKLPAVKPVVCWVDLDPLRKLAETLSPLVPEDPEDPEVPDVPEVPDEPLVPDEPEDPEVPEVPEVPLSKGEYPEITSTSNQG